MIAQPLRFRRPARRRPRILYVTHGIPHVPGPGGSTRAFHLVHAAAQLGEVVLVAVIEGKPVGREDMVGLCAHLHEVPAPHCHDVRSWPGPWHPIAQRISRTLEARPKVTWRFDHEPLRDTVRKVLREEDFDLVVVEHTDLAWALHDFLHHWPGPKLADLHNALSIYERRLRDAESCSWWERLQGSHAVKHLQAMERDILRSYSGVTAVSQVDARCFQRLEPDARVTVVPNGVDLGYFGGCRGGLEWAGLQQSSRLVFTGALWYRPNVDAMVFFIHDVWPHIRAQRPEACISIVGARPSPEVQALATVEGVEIFPSVRDVRPFLSAASVAVVPLRLGTGTRLKILEALAAGLPVVSTTLGAEGLELASGRDLLLADSPVGFATAVLWLLAHPGQAQRLTEQGYRTVRRSYDWTSIGARFQDVLAASLQGARKEAAG